MSKEALTKDVMNYSPQAREKIKKLCEIILEQTELSGKVRFQIIVSEVAQKCSIDYDEVLNILDILKSNKLIELVSEEEAITSDREVSKVFVFDVTHTKFKRFYESMDEEVTISRAGSDKKLYPKKLPKDLKWENITIKFKDGENVVVLTPNNEPMQFNFAEMGFKDSKKCTPVLQWNLLKVLATEGGKVSWDSKHAADKIKKQKQLLSESLKSFFGLIDDPFYPYKKVSAYQVKFRLISEKESINNQEFPREDELGISEYYNENTPLKYTTDDR